MVKVITNSQGKVYTAGGKALISVGGAPSGTISITENGTYDVTDYASANVNVSGGGEFQLTRVKDDTNTEIGTHFMDFTDGNGQKYKVVCLDAQYRKTSTVWCSSTNTVTNMPLYGDLKTSNVWEAKETATQNTQLILDFCSANGYTSTACTHCRSKSFVINNTTYYGQLPNIIEVIHLAEHYNQFDALDTSASSHSSTNFSSSRSIWSSSQYSNYYGRYLSNNCNAGSTLKTDSYFTCPVLEIPY